MQPDARTVALQTCQVANASIAAATVHLEVIATRPACAQFQFVSVVLALSSRSQQQQGRGNRTQCSEPFRISLVGKKDNSQFARCQVKNAHNFFFLHTCQIRAHNLFLHDDPWLRWIHYMSKDGHVYEYYNLLHLTYCYTSYRLLQIGPVRRLKTCYNLQYPSSGPILDFYDQYFRCL